MDQWTFNDSYWNNFLGDLVEYANTRRSGHAVRLSSAARPPTPSAATTTPS